MRRSAGERQDDPGHPRPAELVRRASSACTSVADSTPRTPVRRPRVSATTPRRSVAPARRSAPGARTRTARSRRSPARRHARRWAQATPGLPGRHVHGARRADRVQGPRYIGARASTPGSRSARTRPQAPQRQTARRTLAFKPQVDNGTIKAMTLDAAGNVVVGGSFTSIGGTGPQPPRGGDAVRGDRSVDRRLDAARRSGRPDRQAQRQRPRRGRRSSASSAARPARTWPRSARRVSPRGTRGSTATSAQSRSPVTASTSVVWASARRRT